MTPASNERTISAPSSRPPRNSLHDSLIPYLPCVAVKRPSANGFEDGTFLMVAILPRHVFNPFFAGRRNRRKCMDGTPYAQPVTTNVLLEALQGHPVVYPRDNHRSTRPCGLESFTGDGSILYSIPFDTRKPDMGNTYSPAASRSSSIQAGRFV